MKKTKLRIHIWPEKILKKRCREVEAVDERIRELLGEMYSLMKAGNGVGLAANQAGIDLNLVVVEAQDKLFKLVNPKITKKEGQIIFTEGCLSFPGLELEVKRAKRVQVSALDEKGEILELEAEGILAVIFQHEIDHLNSILFIDRISFWRRLKNYRKLKEIARLTEATTTRFFFAFPACRRQGLEKT